MINRFAILYEDDSVLIVNKPADLVCHPTKQGPDSSLIGQVRVYLGKGTTPHLVNRLDRETSGVVLVAKDAVTARQLRRLWENGFVKKEYWAIVHGELETDAGTIASPLGRDHASRVAIKDCVRQDGKPAWTDFEVLGRFSRGGSPFTFLGIVPRTGRKHQIRIHFASIGHPIVGDKLYGGNEDYYLALVEGRLGPDQRERLLLPNHALHARAVKFEWRLRDWSLRAYPDDVFLGFLPEDALKSRFRDDGADGDKGRQLAQTAT